MDFFYCFAMLFPQADTDQLWVLLGAGLLCACQATRVSAAEVVDSVVYVCRELNLWLVTFSEGCVLVQTYSENGRTSKEKGKSRCYRNVRLGYINTDSNLPS